MKTVKYATKKITVLALLTSFSLIAFILESLIPLPLPGANIGIANAFSFAALIIYSPLEGFAVVIVRTFLGAIFSGNLSALLFSFTGGIMSMTVSSLLMYFIYPKISITAISTSAATFHNITQNIVYVFLTGSALVLGYLPYLALLGVVSGAAVGTIITLVFKSVPQSVFERLLN